MSKTCIAPICAIACAVGLLATVPTATPAMGQDDWHPSEWGADDEIGAANRLTPEKVLEAVKLVKTGKTYPLGIVVGRDTRSEEHTSELQSLMRISYAVFCLKTKKTTTTHTTEPTRTVYTTSDLRSITSNNSITRII